MHFFIIFYAVSRVYKIRIHHVYITYLDHFQYHKKDARNAVKHFLTHHETTGSSEANWVFLDGSHLNKNNVSD